jgi:hypothetical protein
MKKIKSYRSKLLLLTICGTVVLFSGCQSKQTVIDNSHEIESNKSDNGSINLNTSDELNISEVITNEADNNDKESTLQFSELSKYQFVFSSGVGAWQTMLDFNEDGTLKGYYSDSDMGATGEDYPNGTIYSSTFEGKFTTPVKVNEYTYSTSIEYIKFEKEVGTEEIIDGIKYIYSEPNGLNDAKEIYIYTPKAPLNELPEGFRSWVGYLDLNDVSDEHLPFYGLYNVKTESGFSSYEKIIIEKKD